MPERIVLDTDIGDDIDDLYALAFAASAPELDLLGVTTVFKVSQERARVAAKFLRLAGRTDVPVLAGIDWPPARQERGKKDPAASDHTHWVTKDDPEFNVAFDAAVPWVLDRLEQAEEPITLVAIGPLTNIAAVLMQADRKQRSRIKRIAVMGGECALMRAEYNVASDPEAASLVLADGLPVFLGTLSVTKDLCFTMDEVERMFAGDEAPTHKALLEATRLWMPAQTTKVGPVLYDLVPLFHLTDPALVETRRMRVDVELVGERTRGFTVPQADADGNVEVSQAMRVETMRNRLLATLGISPH